MTDRLKKIGLTPAKAALVAVLAIGLGLVWVPQFIGSGSSEGNAASSSRPKSRPAPPRPRRRPGAPVQNARAAAAPIQTAISERELPTLTLSDATGYDPFAVPDWASTPEPLATQAELPVANTASLQQRFESLKAAGVGMVLMSDDGQAAQIGDKTVRVGDEIDGFRVVEITANNIVFQPASGGGGVRSGI